MEAETSGKSTLVASFAASGARIITDDALVVEPRGNQWWAVRSYPGVRLWPETADIVIRPATGADRHQPLRTTTAIPGSCLRMTLTRSRRPHSDGCTC